MLTPRMLSIVAPPRDIAVLLRSIARHRSPSSSYAGFQLHCYVIKSGLLLHLPLPSSLLDFYSKSNHLSLALQLFNELPFDLHTDPVLWSSILSNYSKPFFSLSLSQRMLQLYNVIPDAHIFATLANICAQTRLLNCGKQVHAQFLMSQFSVDTVVNSALVDMYSKCGVLDYARKLFDSVIYKNRVCWTAMVAGYASNGRFLDAVELFERMPDRDLFTWTAFISGLVQSGCCFYALKVFVEMQKEGVVVDDAFVLSSVLGASADMAALELGRQLHCLVIQLGYEGSMIIGNALVDMYAKCSDICSARAAFDCVNIRDVFSWTTMVVGEAQHGKAERALVLFDKMLKSKVKPNEVTFVGLIYACSHAGLVQKGRDLFDSMEKDHGIQPSLQHYTCLLDLLSRSGHLSEAEDLINAMPFEPDEAMWGALLSACKKHGDTEMSIRVADHMMRLKPTDPSTYVLLSNVYAISGKWECVANVRKLMVDLDVKKEAGYSLIELGKERRLFRAGDVPHDIRDDIIKLLEDIAMEMRKRGYVPDTSSVMHDIEENEKEQLLFLHSERLAVAFGLLKSVSGSIIRIVKNLRICGDCHVVLKLTSSIVEREIVVRDATRFHHFKNGGCSCSDFW